MPRNNKLYVYIFETRVGCGSLVWIRDKKIYENYV